MLSLVGSISAVLPDGWTNQDIGTPAPGSADEANGTWTISANGNDIWNNADNFHYVYMPLTGNAQITAQVTDNGTGTNTWAKGGPMFRQDLTAGSANVMGAITGGNGNGATFQWREAADGGCGSSRTLTVAPPYWVRLTRIGNDFTCEMSADGVTWEFEGNNPHNVVMADPVLIGLAVTSHADGEVRTYTIDNVSIELLENPAYAPVPADGEIDVDAASLEWTPGANAVSQKVYLSKDATIDDADLLTETGVNISLAVAILDPGVTYYWRVDEVQADGTVIEGAVWSFTTTPKEAHFPVPADGAVNILSGELSWTPGKGAILHNVYFGTDPAILLPIQMMGMNTTVDPGPLEDGKTYYWRVDEFNPPPVGVVAGPVWSFSSPPIIEITDPNLVGAWTFEEGPGGTVVLDYSGHGNHGMIAGAANQEYVTGVDVPWTPGLSASAMNFLGDNQGFVELPGDMPITAAKGTIMAWINTTQGNSANNDEGMIFWAGPTAGDGDGGENEIHLNIDDPGEGQLDFFIEDDPSGGDKRVQYDNIGGTGWRHVAATWDVTDGLRLYVDGVEVANTSHNGATYGFQTIRLGRPIGTGGGNRFYAGIMDEVMLYDYALSADQIKPFGTDLKLASSPDPADGASGVSYTPILSWTPGEGAVEHDVYFGTDAAQVADANAAVYMGRQAAATFDPGVLEFSTTYYLRVDEVAADGSMPVTTSKVWSFTTAPQVPAFAAQAQAPTDVPGFLIRTLKTQNTTNWNYDAMNEILDTGMWNGEAAVEEGTRTDVFVNLHDTSGRGAFDDAGGYPDATFPGIDPFESPTQDPAAGDDDNNIATEVLGTIQLTAGRHVIGANSDDGTIIIIGGVEVGRTEEGKGVSNRDYVFYVETDGFYTLRTRTREGTGGAALELHEILADGTRILLNDVANGGSAVFAGVRTKVYDFETDAQGWGGLKDGTTPTVILDGISNALRVTIDEAAHGQEQGGWASGRDFTVNDALGAYSTLSFWYRVDDPDMNGGNFVFHWIMSTESWSGGGWYGNGLWGVLIADGQWHPQTVDLSILGEAAGGWQGAWGDQAAWDFRDDLLYSFEILVEPTDSTTTGSNVYIDDIVFK